MIGRGTTPTISFTFKNIDPDDIILARLTVAQGGVNVINIKADGTSGHPLIVEGDKLVFRISEEDTLLLRDDREAEVQCRWATNDITGKSAAYKVTVDKILYDGRLVDDDDP